MALPDKLYFKIGEVAELTGLEDHVLRYWETEFPFLAPGKTAKGQRIYTKKDIETVLKIKHLLYEQKFKIDGVKKLFRNKSEREKVLSGFSRRQRYQRVREGLQEILSLLQ